MPSNKDYLTPGLIRSLGSYAAAVTKRARNLAPQHIRSAITSRVKKSKKGTVGIVTTADKSVAPDAGAWEFGSGIHSRLMRMSPNQLRPKGKYIIAPKRGNVLAFPWDKVNESTPKGKKFRGISSQGNAIFNYVEHPGIVAANDGKGYIAPAIKMTRKTLEDGIDKSVRDAVGLTLKRAFSGGK